MACRSPSRRSGHPTDPTVLLVMGLGTQMIGWPDDLCQDLAGRGYRVVRFDNRDIGLSTHLDGQPAPDLLEVLLRRRKPAYGIGDMARDTVGVIDALGCRAGAPGRVRRWAASSPRRWRCTAPDLLRSLTLIMTSTGSRRVGRPSASGGQVTVLRRRTGGHGPGDRHRDEPGDVLR